MCIVVCFGEEGRMRGVSSRGVCAHIACVFSEACVLAKRVCVRGVCSNSLCALVCAHAKKGVCLRSFCACAVPLLDSCIM